MACLVGGVSGRPAAMPGCWLLPLSLFLCLVTNRCHGSHTHSLPIMAKFPFVSCKQTNLNLMHNPTFRVCTTHTYPSTMTTTMPHSHYPIANKVWKTGEIYRFNRITFELLIPQECLIGMRRTNQPPIPSGLGSEAAVYEELIGSEHHLPVIGL